MAHECARCDGTGFGELAGGQLPRLEDRVDVWSSVNRFSCTAFSDAIAATVLLIDAAWNIVRGLIGVRVSESATP